MNSLNDYKIELLNKLNGIMITTPKGNTFVMNAPAGLDEEGIKEAVKKSRYSLAEAYQEFLDLNNPTENEYKRACAKYNDYKDMRMILAGE